MTPIYHITHITNLPGIVQEDGLLCDGEAARRQLCAQAIAYDTIKERRKRRRVEKLNGQPVAVGGVLADYVPFYFSNRSPMLYAIHKGTVPAYQGGQREVVYLVAYAENVAATLPSWCFTDGHAVEAVTEFYSDLGDLQRVDWDAVQTWRWGGRWLLANPDVKRRKQAEFLVHGRVPWRQFHALGVLDGAMAARVGNALVNAAHKPQVTIQADWYYSV
jgi:ssDNA thymidine ADP-ribosyltransferase, DarT